MNAHSVNKTASGIGHPGDLGKTSMPAKSQRELVEEVGAAKMTRDVRAKAVFTGLNTYARAVLLALLSLAAIIGIIDSASAQNPYQFKKEAFKLDGTPWTGPVNVGDIIKYVLSYKPGTTNSGPVTIDDTLSPNQIYLPPTKASDSDWTWGSSPYLVGNHELYKHPGFGPNTGTVKVTVTGQPVPVPGTGDGTIPIPILSLNKVFGVFHHAAILAQGKVDCWDLTTLAKCGTAQFNAISGFLNTPYTPQSVVRGTTIYFLGYRASSGNAVSIGCFEGATQTACADIPLGVNVANMGDLAGLVEDNAGRVFAAVNNKVYCRMLPAGATCAGWPAAGIVSVTGAISPSYPSNVLYVSMEYGPSPTRLYIHHGNAIIQCIDTNLLIPCPGSWTAAGTKIPGQNDGIMLSSFPLSGPSGDGGVCLWKQLGGQVGCLNNLGGPNLVTPTSVLNPALSSFRLPNSGRVFFPTHGPGGPKCFDYSGSTGGACAGFTSPTPPPNGLQYGFALDPLDPAKCMLTLGDKNVLWRFDYITGKIGCGKEVVTPKIEDIYCNGTPTLATFQWTTVRALTPGAAGTLYVTKGTGSAVPVTISGTTAQPLVISPGYGQLSFTYTPNSGAPTTVDFEIGYVSDKNPQICYQAQVTTCGGPVFNDAVFKGSFNGSSVNVSQHVDLGKAIGPDCPELTGCLKDMKVAVKCNPDGTYTLTLSGSGFTGSDITLTSQTPGVTVTPPQQLWTATTTWTVTGATAGQSVTLTATTTKTGGGGAEGSDLCCSAEIKIVMPECPKPPIDVKVDKENTPSGGQGNGFNIWVTNVGAPITFGPGQLTVDDVVPAGLKIFTQTSPNWTCNPLPATGLATIHCTYNLAGSLGTGAQLTDSIVFNGVLTNHEQPVKNCAIVSIPATVGVDTNPSNDQACVTVQDVKVGRLIFTKHAVFEGPIPLPNLSYTVNVLCGSNSTILTLSNNSSQAISNIPYNTICSYSETTPTVPPNMCPPNRTGVWTTVFTPPSSITINVPVTNVSVTNTLICKPNDSLVDVGIKKTGGTTPVQQPFYVFDLTVTNVGAAISTAGAIVVTDTVPANMTFNTIGGSGWTCVPPGGPAGTLITCTYNGLATAGQVLPVIHVDATATGGAPYPPVTNCVQVGVTTASGLADTNSANNNSCVTVTKPKICPPPQVSNVDGICVYPPPACLPPMVPGAVPGQCICPQGTVLRGRECVKVPTCQPPMVPGAIPGQCICPQGTVLRGRECVKVPTCQPPMIPGPVAGVCVCPQGTVQKGRECVRRIDCRSPMVPNAAGNVCICPPGTLQKGRECVRPTVCNPPAKLNRRGACECPTNMVARGNGCIAQPRQLPGVTPGRTFPGNGRDNPTGPRGGSQGLTDFPGRR